MFGLWYLHFCGFLLLPLLAVSLGWRDRLRKWLSQETLQNRQFWVYVSYPATILMDQAAVWSIHLPQVKAVGCLISSDTAKRKF